MDLKLKDKVVAISGGTSGIGEAVALGFAREGAKVAVCGRKLEKIAALDEKFKAEGFELTAIQADISKPEDNFRFVDEVVAKLGRIDVLINNAGVNSRKPFEEYTPEDFQSVVNTDLGSVLYGCQAAAKYMKKQGGGCIINTSSFTASIPTCGIAIYSATKAGVEQFTRVFAVELAKDKIRVNAVEPGYVVTPLTQSNVDKNFNQLVSAIPMKRLSVPEDLVPTYLYLASEEMSSYVTGEVLRVTGGKLATQNPHYSYREEGATY